MCVRAVQVGLGGWGTDWARRVLPHTDALQVVARADPAPERRQSFARALGLPTASVHTTFEEAWRDAGAEAVLVTAAIPAHGALTRAALAAGAHVLLEKPFTLDLDEAVALARQARAAGRVLMIAQNYRFQAAALRVREVLADGAIGELRNVRIRFRKDHTYPVGGPGAERSPDSSLLYQISVHHLDLVRFLVGDLREVSARRWSRGQAPGVMLSAFDALWRTDEVVLGYSASSASGAPSTPWCGTWHLEGERGDLVWGGHGDAHAGRIRLRRSGGTETAITVPDVLEDRAAVVAEFVAAIRDGRPSGIEAAANLSTVAALLALERALDEPGWVPVPDPRPAL